MATAGLHRGRSNGRAETRSTDKESEGSRTTEARPPGARGRIVDLDNTAAPVITNNQDLEGVTRPLLEALSKMAGLESTYLMVFDWAQRRQEILFAYNSDGPVVEEAMRVAIGRGLSPEALPGVTRSLETLPEAPPDSQIAKDLGLRTHVSVPVVVAPHRLWGMLCGASRAPRHVSESVITAMEHLAHLVAEHVVRQQTAATERRAEVAEETLRARAVFLAQTEHELKVPLTVIEGMARTLAQDWESLTVEERSEFLDTVVSNVARLSSQIENLLEEARAEVRALSLEPRELEITQVLRATARAFDGAFPDHQVVSESEREVKVVADRGTLEQALGLLLDNAVKYSPEGGTIRLTARAADGGAVIEVADEGLGIPDDVDVWAPFQRGGVAQRLSPGVGLGLHVVRNLVLAMGGSVEARRNPDRGSTFEITLPARNLQASALRA
jgi:signal transduction histidine kinase